MCSKTPDGRCYGRTGLRDDRPLHRLFYKLATKHPVLICSRFGVEVLMLMCCVGAGGKTAEALKHALGAKDLDAFCSKYGKIIDDLNKVQSITMIVANVMYVKTGYEIKQTFEDTVKNKLFSEVAYVDFADGANSAAIINAWAETKTNEKIKQIISPEDIDADTRLILANAVYFKGNWERSFDATETWPEPFYLSNGTEKQVEMMHAEHYYSFTESEELNSEILEMPYKDDDFALLIFLPNARDGIGRLKESVHKFNVTGLSKTKTKAAIGIPRFKIETEIQLDDVLKEMGLDIVFGLDADFSNITSNEGLRISKIVQKAFVEVNEEGTEAAAVTVAKMTLLSLAISVDPIKRFIVDHEFIFAVKYKHVILFMGAYS